MSQCRLLTVLLLFSLAALPAAVADEVRFFEKDGVTYRETRRVVSRPVTETRLEQREQTVYREQLRSEVQESYRTYHAPVTEYQWVAYMHGRWNPFIQPYYTYQLTPVRRWESRQEVVRTPVQRRELVPEKRIVQVPVTSSRMAEEEVITRVAVATAPVKGAVGGVARMESDPPRRSTTTRPAPSTSKARY